MTQVVPDHLPLLDALREPSTAHILFMVSLPLAAADCASEAFDAMLRQLRRHGRRLWRSGSEERGPSEAEIAVLGLVEAQRALQCGTPTSEQRFLAAALPQWLVRPEGQQQLARQAALLARALAAADLDQRARPAITAA